MNTEDKQIIERGKALQEMTSSEGWVIARKKIIDKIMELQSIMNLDLTDMQALVVDAKARTMAIAYMSDLLKEIEGDVEQFENNYPDEDDDGYIRRD